MAEFTKDRYGVDVMKVEVPINMKFVEGAKPYGGQTAYTRDEAKKLFLEGREGRDEAVHLSVGRRQQRGVHRIARARRRIRRALLRRALRPRDLEGRHSASTRKKAPPRSAKWLETKGVENIKNVNAALKPARAVVSRSTARRARTRWLR